MNENLEQTRLLPIDYHDVGEILKDQLTFLDKIVFIQDIIQDIIKAVEAIQILLLKITQEAVAQIHECGYQVFIISVGLQN